jgi:hypothetical protein
VSTPAVLLLMARYAVLAWAEVAKARFLQVRDWAVAKASGRKRPPRDVHPGEMPVYFRGDRGDS